MLIQCNGFTKSFYLVIKQFLRQVLVKALLCDPRILAKMQLDLVTILLSAQNKESTAWWKTSAPLLMTSARSRTIEQCGRSKALPYTRRTNEYWIGDAFRFCLKMALSSSVS